MQKGPYIIFIHIKAPVSSNSGTSTIPVAQWAGTSTTTQEITQQSQAHSKTGHKARQISHTQNRSQTQGIKQTRHKLQHQAKIEQGREPETQDTATQVSCREIQQPAQDKIKTLN